MSAPNIRPPSNSDKNDVPASEFSRSRSIRARTAENVVILVLLQWVSRAFSIFTKIVLVRLLFPGDFGVFTLAVGFIGFLSTFGNFGLDYAIVQMGDAARRIEYDVAMTLRLILSVALFAITFFLAIPWATLFGVSAVSSATQVLALVYLISPWGFVPGTKLTANLRYRALLLPNVANQVTNASIAIVLAVLGFGFWSLVIAMVASQLSWVVSLTAICPWRFSFRLNRAVGSRILKYARHLVAASLLAFLMTNIDNFTVGFFLGAVALGYYAVAYNFCLFSSMVSGSAASALFPSFARIRDDPTRLRRGYVESFGYAIATAAPVAVGMAVMAPELVDVVLGSAWRPTTVVLVVLAFYGLSKAVLDFSTPLFAAAGHPRAISELNALVLVTSICLLIPLTLGYGLVGAGLAMTIPVALGAIAFHRASLSHSGLVDCGSAILHSLHCKRDRLQFGSDSFSPAILMQSGQTNSVHFEQCGH